MCPHCVLAGLGALIAAAPALNYIRGRFAKPAPESTDEPKNEPKTKNEEKNDEESNEPTK